MRVLKPKQSNTVEIALRDYSSNDIYDIIITNENNGAETVIVEEESTASIQANNNQLSFEFDNTANDGGVYSIKILDNANGKVLFRGKFFYTSQVPQNYNINE